MRLVAFVSQVPWTTGAYYIRALRAAGHRVTVVAPAGGAGIDAVRTGLFSAAEVMNRLAPDAEAAVFFESGARAFPADTGRLPCLTAWYAIDTHLHTSAHARIARLFDVTFLAQKEYTDRIRRDGCRQVHWLPLAADSALFDRERPAAPSYDIAFVGSVNPRAHPARSALIRRVLSRYERSFVGSRYLEAMADVYLRSRIVFNRAVRNDINMRIFEAMAAGALLVTDEIADNGFEELFRPGENLVTYADERDLLQKLDYFLAHEEERQAIAECGRRLVLGRHTYAHRVEQFVRTLASATPGTRLESKASLRTLWSAGRLAAGWRAAGWVTRAFVLGAVPRKAATGDGRG